MAASVDWRRALRQDGRGRGGMLMYLGSEMMDCEVSAETMVPVGEKIEVESRPKTVVYLVCESGLSTWI